MGLFGGRFKERIGQVCPRRSDPVAEGAGWLLDEVCFFLLFFFKTTQGILSDFRGLSATCVDGLIVIRSPIISLSLSFLFYILFPPLQSSYITRKGRFSLSQ